MGKMVFDRPVVPKFWDHFFLEPVEKPTFHNNFYIFCYNNKNRW